MYTMQNATIEYTMDLSQCTKRIDKWNETGDSEIDTNIYLCARSTQ